ncbi:MAG: Holliday junction DNA helicase RuvA [Verrucomicrobia bacterium GWF2_51_19]|nr:MAG: Holliday junction DNA helicase RuvA [Verrucomicrobia bacterium GWF2_51_19]HCJ12297.1 Holliday junction branch migration protein RuvA [Opitutae bacterium]
MIVSLQGTLVEKGPLTVTVETQGIGYQVWIPLSTYDALPAVDKHVKLFIHAVYREDAQTLYGFATQPERDFFRLIVDKVSGVGPKTALSIFSKLPLSTLKMAIAQNDVKLLSECPGIGKKTAERIVLELQDKKLPELTPAALPPPRLQEAISALLALGYKPQDAEKVLLPLYKKLGSKTSTEALIRAALGKKTE